MYGISITKLKKYNIKELRTVFSDNIDNIFNEFKFARISYFEEEAIINDTLLKVQNNLDKGDINYIYKFLNNTLREEIITFLKKFYANRIYELILKLIVSKIGKVDSLNSAIKNLNILTKYLIDFDLENNDVILKTIASNNEVKTSIQFIIDNKFKKLDNLENKDIVFKLISFYNPEYNIKFLRSKCHDLFGILYMYDKDDILEVINKLPEEYKNILQLRFGINYDEVIKNNEWKNKYNYLFNREILPLIKNMLIDKSKNSTNENEYSDIRNKDIFTIFIDYPFNLIINIINSLSIDEQRILQDRFGVNYNDLIKDNEWDKKYRHICYNKIIPFILRRAKRLVNRSSNELENIEKESLLNIFSNYDKEYVLKIIKLLNKDEINYLQYLYGKKYDEVPVNEVNNNYLNSILSKLRILIKEKKEVFKSKSQSLLSLFRFHDYNILLNVINSLPDFDKQLIIKRFGTNFNLINENIREEEKIDIKKRIIPKIRRKVLKIEASFLINNIQVDDENLKRKLLIVNKIYSSTYFQELLNTLTYEEATIIAFKYIGFDNICFTTEEVAEYLGLSIIEVIDKAKIALKKYNKVARRRLFLK